MDKWQILVKSIFVNQSKQDYYCSTFPKDISLISKQLKKCEYLYDESFANIIVYQIINTKLNILYLSIQNIEFFNTFVCDFKQYSVYLLLPKQNSFNQVFKKNDKVIAMYQFKMNNQNLNKDLIVLKNQAHLLEDYYNIHQDCWYDFKNITKNNNYKVYVAIYNNEMVGYADVYIDNDFVINSMYFLPSHYTKLNINTLINYIMQHLNIKSINIMSDNELLKEFCLNEKCPEVTSFISYIIN